MYRSGMVSLDATLCVSLCALTFTSFEYALFKILQKKTFFFINSAIIGYSSALCFLVYVDVRTSIEDFVEKKKGKATYVLALNFKSANKKVAYIMC